MTDDVVTAGEGDHLRHPVTGAVERLEPLQTSHPRAAVRFAAADLFDALAQIVDQRRAGLAPSCGRADAENIVEDFRQAMRIQRNDLGCAAECRCRLDHLVIIQCADLA